MPAKRKPRAKPRDREDLLQDDAAIEAVRRVWNDRTKSRSSGAGDFDEMLAETRKQVQEERRQRAAYDEIYERTSRAADSRGGCLSTIATLGLIATIAPLLLLFA